MVAKRLLSLVAATALAFATAVPSSDAAQLRRVPLYRTGIVSDDVGLANLVVRDVYGSSFPEIVSCSQGAGFALSYSDGAYRRVWHTAPIKCTAVAVGDVNADGVIDAVIGTGSTDYWAPALPTFQVFTPQGFAGPRATVGVPGTTPVTDIAIGNVDSDAAAEIVVITSSNAYVYDGATLALEWTASGRGGHTVLIGDLEGDGPAEIVISGSDGHVLNAVTQSFKWGYVGGFGSCVTLGDIDADGKAEIVAGFGGTVRILHGDVQELSTFQTTSYSIQAIAVGDGNNDGVPEIVIGEDQWGEILGWSPAGVKLWYVNNPEHGVSGVAIGDPDADGVNEAVWGAGYTSSGTDGIFVGNTSTHSVEWQAPDQDGHFMSAAGDLDGDGDVELVVAMAASDSGYGQGVVEVHDLEGGVLASILMTSWTMDVQDVAIGQLDSDEALEIAVLTYYYSNGTVEVYDGVTFMRQTSIPSNSGMMNFIVRNIDADPVDEIILGTTDKKIQILNGASSFIQASTPVLDGTIKDFSVADLNADGVLDLVVGTTAGFYVFRLSDLTELAHTTLSSISRVAAAPGEFAIAADTVPQTIVAYDGSTLLERWRCTPPVATVGMHYATVDGTRWLAVADTTMVKLYPSGGSSCPTAVAAEHLMPNITDFALADTTGDGAPELLLSTHTTTQVDLFGFDTDPRGDADGDGNAFDDDIDALAQWLYGAGPGIDAAADANGNFAVQPDDLIYLINYHRGTGAAPPQ